MKLLVLGSSGVVFINPQGDASAAGAHRAWGCDVSAESTACRLFRLGATVFAADSAL